MSETPHCPATQLDARCCNHAKFCYENSGDSDYFLMIFVTQVVESKRLLSGSSVVAGSWPETATNVLRNTVKMHLREQPCI